MLLEFGLLDENFSVDIEINAHKNTSCKCQHNINYTTMKKKLTLLQRSGYCSIQSARCRSG